MGNQPKILIYQGLFCFLLTWFSFRRHSNRLPRAHMKQHIFAWDCGLYLINTILWFQELVKIWFWRKGFLSSTDNPSSWLVQSNVLLHLLEVLLCCPGQLNKEWVPNHLSFITSSWLDGCKEFGRNKNAGWSIAEIEVVTEFWLHSALLWCT